MFCKNCGCELKDDVKFCPECGAATTSNQVNNANVNQQQQYNANVNQQQQYNGQAPNNYPPTDPGFNQNATGLNVLGFLIPLVGLILFCVYNSNEPVKAKGIGKWALIGFGVGIACSIIYSIIVASAVSSYGYY